MRFCQWMFAVVIIAISSTSLARIKLPIDGTTVIVIEEEILPPFNKVDNYIYAKGRVFDRWIYSPWVLTRFSYGEQEIIRQGKTPRRGMISADLTVDTSSFAADEKYNLLLSTTFTCKGESMLERGSCQLRYLVRCYTSSGGGWKIDTEKTKSISVDRSGSFEFSDLQVNGATCAELGINLQGSVSENGYSYSFQDMKIALQRIN